MVAVSESSPLFSRTGGIISTVDQGPNDLAREKAIKAASTAVLQRSSAPQGHRATPDDSMFGRLFSLRQKDSLCTPTAISRSAPVSLHGLREWWKRANLKSTLMQLLYVSLKSRASQKSKCATDEETKRWLPWKTPRFEALTAPVYCRCELLCGATWVDL